MKTNIFREKSLERIESPEHLNAYIKVANPGVWLILVTIIVFLSGILVWGVFGDLSIYTPAIVAPNDGSIASLHTEYIVYVHEEDSGPVGLNQNVEIEGNMYRICDLDENETHLVLFGGSRNEEDVTMAHYLGHELSDNQNLWLIAYGLDYSGDDYPIDQLFICSRVEIAKRSPLSFLFD